jgi:hypothetical protein
MSTVSVYASKKQKMMHILVSGKRSIFTSDSAQSTHLSLTRYPSS